MNNPAVAVQTILAPAIPYFRTALCLGCLMPWAGYGKTSCLCGKVITPAVGFYVPNFYTFCLLLMNFCWGGGRGGGKAAKLPPRCKAPFQPPPGPAAPLVGGRSQAGVAAPVALPPSPVRSPRALTSQQQQQQQQRGRAGRHGQRGRAARPRSAAVVRDWAGAALAGPKRLPPGRTLRSREGRSRAVGPSWAGTTPLRSQCGSASRRGAEQLGSAAGWCPAPGSCAEPGGRGGKAAPAAAATRGAACVLRSSIEGTF